MWWGLGALGMFLYFFFLVWLGLTCLRNGHWVLFIIGIFLPLLWIVGALIRPRAQTA